MKTTISTLSAFVLVLGSLFVTTPDVSAIEACTDFGGTSIASIQRFNPSNAYQVAFTPYTVDGTTDFVYNVDFAPAATDVSAGDFMVGTIGSVTTGGVTVSSDTGSAIQVTVNDVSGTGSFYLYPANQATCWPSPDPILDLTFFVNQMVENPAPTVTNVTSSLPNATYTTGNVITVTVQFSEPVKFSAGFNANLDLDVGPNAGTATLVGGPFGVETTTNELTFTYTVVAGDMTPDLQYQATSALTLLAGTAMDTVTDASASLTLPNLPSENSLAGNKAIVIDAPAPVLPEGGNGGGGGGSWVDPVQAALYAAQQSGTTTGTSSNAFCSAIEGYWDVGERGVDVQKIQMFLNVYMNARLQVTGIYDLPTFEAVKAFQQTYSKYILAPWELTPDEATGFWYKTTSKFANYMVGCDTGQKVLESGVVVDEYDMPPTQFVTILTKPFWDFISEKYKGLSTMMVDPLKSGDPVVDTNRDRTVNDEGIPVSEAEKKDTAETTTGTQ